MFKETLKLLYVRTSRFLILIPRLSNIDTLGDEVGGWEERRANEGDIAQLWKESILGRTQVTGLGSLKRLRLLRSTHEGKQHTGRRAKDTTKT